MIKIRFINILLPRTHTEREGDRDRGRRGEAHILPAFTRFSHGARKKEMNEKMATGPANGNGYAVKHGTGV